MSTPVSLQRVPHHAVKLFKVVPVRIAHTTFTRCLATVHHGPRALPGVWFNGSTPHRKPANSASDHKPPDERTIKLGKTLRILQARLPTLLQSPLPSEILSPQISLHLFPSTHPHLPTVTGRVAYVAALWTSPLAWGRVPIVGNVKLEILSERMVKKSSSESPIHYSSSSSGYRSEQLVVRWRTCGKTKGKGTGPNYTGIGASEQVDKITEILGGSEQDDSKEFTGLFIFEFDEEGRIVSHTIEHVQEGGNWEKGVGARVVGLTDWLLGGMKGKGEEGTPCPACCAEETRR